MCGIIGIVAQSPANQILYDGLQLLQHRGQDAAGIVTASGSRFHMHKGSGMVRDVFRTRNMRSLAGNAGIAHVRYPTAGSASSVAEAQPFYVNSPYGLVLAHNGNLTNTEALKEALFRQDLRHLNTQSDSEVLINVFAHELHLTLQRGTLNEDTIFAAVREVYRRVRGAYAVVLMIAGFGLVAFRDPNGIRPLILGAYNNEQGSCDYMVASESVALDGCGFTHERDIAPGEAVIIRFDGTLTTQVCADRVTHTPCMFEYVYFARPDSIIDGASVYETRLKMGEKLGDKIRRDYAELAQEIDVVIPIPDTSLPSALQLANHLNLPFRLGFIKNRYVGRTFIMPGQAVRKKSVRQKLNAMAHEFVGKNVLLVDDSIVRGTTSREIVQMARDAGAKKVYFASAAPAVRYPNVYGIDMPTRSELLATNRTEADIAREIGADAVIYQDLDALQAAVHECNPALSTFETSCFDGNYVTGDIDETYLTWSENTRSEASQQRSEAASGGTLDMNMNIAEQNLM